MKQDAGMDERKREGGREGGRESEQTGGSEA